MTQYDASFYDTIEEGCIRSANYVAPIVYDILDGPSSVVDFGCGRGFWLAAFSDVGASTVVGLDGSYVDRDRLAIPRESFVPVDFDSGPAIDVGRFDLAISLEVAEHVRPPRAGWFVDQLCRASDVILFSAAIPGQGGTGHVNEQWPDYWVALFEQAGYRVSGALRWLLWDKAPDPVENWYAQNMLLCVRQAELNHRGQLFVDYFDGVAARPFSLVHPALYDARR